MMKQSTFSILVLAIFVLGLTTTSCTKDPDIRVGEPTTSVTDYTTLLGIIDLDEIDDATSGDLLKSTSESDFSPCFEVTVHKNDNGEFWPRSWTFSYSDETCMDCFGNIKTGSIHVSLTDFWKNEESSRTITFEDFSINGNNLAGTRTILNTGLNESQNLTFERSFQNASYSRGDTATMTWESNRNVEMIAGFETFIAADDEYLVSGGASGINYDGKSFTVSITDALHYKKCTQFPVSGSITIEAEGASSITINYGDGECDLIAEMTVDDITTEITLGSDHQSCRNN